MTTPKKPEIIWVCINGMFLGDHIYSRTPSDAFTDAYISISSLTEFLKYKLNYYCNETKSPMRLTLEEISELIGRANELQSILTYLQTATNEEEK